METYNFTANQVQPHYEQIHYVQIHCQEAAAADSIPEYSLPSANEDVCGNANFGNTADSFQNHQRFQERDGKQGCHEQSVATGSFMSVIEDPEFLQTGRYTACQSFPTSAEEFDPFHSDWPYWEIKR